MTATTDTAGQLASVDAVRDFVRAGRARFTVSNPSTGNRATYRVRRMRKGDGYFVDYLAGPDNGGDYQPLGYLWPDGFVLRRGGPSPDSRVAVIFRWLHDAVLTRGELPPPVEIWHEGRCGRCGRVLTVPESIATGLGPVCAAAGA